MKTSHTFLFVLAAFILIAATAATGTKYYTIPNKAQSYTWAVDTITDAENDTLTIADLQTSNWYGLLQVDGKQLTGTQLLAIIVQASAFDSPDADQWYEVQRDTANGSLEQVNIDLEQLDAFNYRIIIDGAGTQSSEYEAVLNLKKD